MDTKSFRVEGELILVEKILEKQTAMEKNGVFKGVVKIVQFGEEVKTEGLSVGDRVLVRDPEYGIYECKFTKECYIHRGQILRTS